MRNVEIKAKLENPESVIVKAEALSDSKCTIIKQHDIFFKVNEGRLKLRQFDDGSGELIYYERPDVKGPKLCNYKKTSIEPSTVPELKEILSSSNGILGEVKKVRQLYKIGQTRVHIDNVNGLGNFMELEVVLNDNQEIEEGEKIAVDLMDSLGVKQENLLSGAYMDLLLKN